MSWFDAAGLANIAKSALKGAQRTIDKALDIKDEDLNFIPTNTPIDTNSDDFFGTWGITQSGNINIKDDKKDTYNPGKEPKLTSSIWGSFTGSFFDTAKEDMKSPSIDSLDDSLDINHEHFSQSKLVVQHTDDVDTHLSNTDNENNSENKPLETTLQEDIEGLFNVDLDSDVNDAPSFYTVSPLLDPNEVKKREKSVASSHNRLSVVSTESGKNSSESVELITECTTSPESEVLSLGPSISTSSSILGLKNTSDSFEVLPDSLTSPSSVEVLGTHSNSSRRESQLTTNDFVSPLESPVLDEKLSSPTDKISPESVEVIPEDQDESSVAEDTMSYTSVSESTSATVLDSAFNAHMKPQKMLKDTYNRNEIMHESINSDVPISPEKNFNLSDAITRAPSRTSMHLPLTQINQVLIDTQPQSSKQDMSHILKKTNIIDIPNDNDSLKSVLSETQLDASTDEGSQSDKTLIGTDNIMESSSDTSTTTETSGNSLYLKTMLADAMVEKNSDHLVDLTQSMIDSTQESIIEHITISQLDMPHRENSSISSESRSDLVKIGSDHTSGHTSGDELETTTSSDIEIISSPNGDSSSTQSRQSPAKQTCLKTRSDDTHIDNLLSKMTMKKAKGHTRELSEASSISDDSHSSEVERLIKRISEMTEILETRESKLIDINRRNAELQELNNDLKHQLDSVLTKQLQSDDLCQVTEEYTQRLSALEKKFQQAIREKDTLKKQLEQSKQDMAMRMSKGELESLITEKDETIKELREEGEKLSKQQLQHSNIIKKLRLKEKEHESSIKHLKESVESLSTENDRLKRSLTAKEEVERSQIEAVHQLTAKNKKLENDNVKMQSEIDDLGEKLETVKKSLEAAKKELIDKNKASSELQAREQLLENLEMQKRMTESQNEEMLDQLEDLRLKLRQADQDYVKKEQALKLETTELLRRLEEAEGRNEELSQTVLEVSKPLMRQLESLQATHNLKVSNFEKIEQELTIKLNDLQSRLHSAINSERSMKEECVSIKSKLAVLEGKLASLSHENEVLNIKVQQQNTEKDILVQEYKSEIENSKLDLKSEKLVSEEKERQITALQQQLNLQLSANIVDAKNSTVQDNGTSQQQESRPSPPTGSNSPTLSLGKISISDSLGSSFWSQDEHLDVAQTPRYTNMFEMQILQSSLKQRDGEVQQLQWELNRREQERSLLNSEISSLLIKVEELQNRAAEYDVLKEQFHQLQREYDTLCQLYGEKVEENEEIKLDLQDVKDMYKSQIDELLKQQKQKA